MATERETIMNGPQGKVARDGKIPFLRTLFNNFCRYANSNLVLHRRLADA